MRIYSMTATFGKLENQTITFEKGLNIIEAPNEWGKSTWCAFLVAMLYGIDTRERTKTGVLADKQHYAPWSGQPMSGSIRLEWEGRDITIERSSTARIPFGEFRAYETESGLNVRELTAANCGLQLLGVEKEVFLRSAFLRLKDLPVTADDTLRRRLNSLVTTGNENEACDDLEKQLRAYKNACRSNSVTGLLPQAEAEAANLEEKIKNLQELQQLIGYTKRCQTDTEVELSAYENHIAALKYEANRTYQEKLAAELATQSVARLHADQLEKECQDLPELGAAQQQLSHLQVLADQRADLQLKLSMLPQPPQPPQVQPPYMGATTDTAVQQAWTDFEQYRQLSAQSSKKGLLIAGIAAIVLGAGAAWIPWQYAIYAGIGVGAIGLILAIVHFASAGKVKKQCAALQAKYAALPQQWVEAAENYVNAYKDYQQQLQSHQAQGEALRQQVRLLEEKIAQAAGETGMTEMQQYYRDVIRRRQELEDARKEAQRCDTLVQAMQSSYQEAPPPRQPDDLLLSEEETLRRIAALQLEQQQLHHKLGQFQGQAQTLGQEAALQAELTQVRKRIAKLNQYHKALQYALDKLDSTKKELQSRFAPQITKRAQALMGAMTGGRYDRLLLEQDLTLRAGASGETQTYEALWRSDGTVDQLYLALRLAVSEELLPEVPFILDDALVRFDDARLSAALQLLQQTADQKQVILFTCQSREKRILDT